MVTILRGRTDLDVDLGGDGEIPRANSVIPAGTVGLVGVGAIKEGARDLASVTPQDRDGGLWDVEEDS